MASATMAEQLLEITETDEAGNTTATYIASPTDTKGTCRIDVIVSLHLFTHTETALVDIVPRLWWPWFGVRRFTAGDHACCKLTTQ